MSSSNLIHWSGLAAFVGGLLFILFDILETFLFGSLPYTQAAVTGTWIIVQGGYLLAGALIGLGLVGLYAHQAQEADMFGLVAFVVTFIGELMAAGSNWSETFFGGWLARLAPDLLEADPSGTLAAGLVLSYILFALGWLLFGLASLRARVLPRTASLLLMIGALIFPIFGALSLPLAGLVFGIAIAWMGYALWSASGSPALIAEAAR